MGYEGHPGRVMHETIDLHMNAEATLLDCLPPLARSLAGLGLAGFVLLLLRLAVQYFGMKY